jgi:hypothetical protein
MSTPVEDLSIFVSTAIFMNAIIAVAVSGASFERDETGWERTWNIMDIDLFLSLFSTCYVDSPKLGTKNVEAIKR